MFDQGTSESFHFQHSLQASTSSGPAASQAVQLFRRSRPRSSTILQRQKGINKQKRLAVQKSTHQKLSTGSNHSSRSHPTTLLDPFSCMVPTQQTTSSNTLSGDTVAPHTLSTQQQLLALLQQGGQSSATAQQQQQQPGNAGAPLHHSRISTQPDAAPAVLATSPVHNMMHQQHQQQLRVMLQGTTQTNHATLQQQQLQQQLPRRESLHSSSPATPAALRNAFEAAVAPNPPLAVAAVVSRLLISVGARHISHDFAAQLKDQVMDSVMQAAAAADAAGRPFVPEQVLLQMIPEMKAAVMRAWTEKKARTRAAEDVPDLAPEQQYRITALKAAMAIRAASAAANAAGTVVGDTGCTTTSLQSQQTEEQGEHSSGHGL